MCSLRLKKKMNMITFCFLFTAKFSNTMIFMKNFLILIIFIIFLFWQQSEAIVCYEQPDERALREFMKEHGNRQPNMSEELALYATRGISDCAPKFGNWATHCVRATNCRFAHNHPASKHFGIREFDWHSCLGTIDLNDDKKRVRVGEWFRNVTGHSLFLPPVVAPHQACAAIFGWMGCQQCWVCNDTNLCNDGKNDDHYLALKSGGTRVAEFAFWWSTMIMVLMMKFANGMVFERI